MPTVWIPSLLRTFTDQQESVHVRGASLREVIDALDAKFPGIQARLCQNDAVRPGMSVVIDGQIARGGLSESVQENSEVHFIPAIAGGDGCRLPLGARAAPRERKPQAAEKKEPPPARVSKGVARKVDGS